MENQMRKSKMKNKTKTYVTKKDNGLSTSILDKIEFNWGFGNNIKVQKVIYNDPATIVYFTDGSRTVVKRYKDDPFDEQTGLLMCIAKRFLGDDFHKVLKDNVKGYKKKKVKIKICRFEIDEDEFFS